MAYEDWSAMVAFSAVAEARSFTKAGQKVGLTPSALSHAVRKLEARLDVQLLTRTTRSVAVTPMGARLLSRMGPAQTAVDEAIESLNELRDLPIGSVRVTVHRAAASRLVLSRMALFADTYPGITVELAVNDALVDIVAEGYDAGIRLEGLIDDDLICVRVGPHDRVAFVASPSYLATRPMPQMPADLVGHRCLNYRYTTSGRLHRWRFERGGEETVVDLVGPLILNDLNLLMEAAVDGVGIASVNESRVRTMLADGTLVRVLEDWSPDLPADCLYYPSHRSMTAALRSFIDHIQPATG